jgi:ribose transport system substrate-binding protein
MKEGFEMARFVKVMVVLVVLSLAATLLPACATPTPETVIVKETQVVTVKETQVVTVKETQQVQVVVTATPEPKQDLTPVFDYDPAVTAKKPYKIAVVLKNFTNPFWLTHQKSAMRAAADFGVEVTVLAPSKPDNVEEQIRIVEDLIQKGVDGVIIAPANTTAIATAIQKLNAAGIPVVYDNTRGSGGDYVAYIGADNILVGKTMADEMVKRLGGTGKVLVLEGLPGQQTADDRRKGVSDVLNANAGLTIVQQTAHWTRVEGLQVTENVLQRYPDLNGIIGIGGEMALGAVEAIKSQGGDLSKILIQAMDVYPDIVTAMRAGDIDYTISQAPGNQAYYSVSVMVKYLNGEQVPAEIRTPVVVVTMDNVDQYAEE